MNYQTQPLPTAIVAEQTFIRRVYNWMAAGLGLSALISFYMMQNESLILAFVQSPIRYWGVFIAELALVFWLSARVHKMAAGQATFLFFLYAGLNGISLSPIFLIYTKTSIASTFFVAAATFGATSFYGYVTKKNLNTVGSYAMMGLIGVIVASLVNGFFLQSSGLDWIISLVAVAIAVGLTAYDTQKIKEMGLMGFGGNQDVETRAAIIGALRLYLDFVLLFIYLLRFLGDRR